ncbi:MAG TPA: class I SAM-dependent methyltransferase [Solirubrobacteraceae bacterium]|nr:class I SAM-dependent methyltransferase [Solirubrobacteraceae bacterium]
MAAISGNRTPTRDARAAIAEVPMWYHSIEVAPGVVTPGMFDLRPIVKRLPWPDVRGRRVLDVGTSDGFLAFELERRGAAEVVAVDIPSHEAWDFELENRAGGPEYLRYVAGPTTSIGFRVAHELLRSSVHLRQISVYDLSPGTVGEFDVVVCGTLLLHLRDPFGALAAIRSVCRGEFLCTNQIELGLSVLHRRRPVARLDGTSRLIQWWLPNAAAHRQMLRAAGFELMRESGLYSVRFGPAHHAPGRAWWRSLAHRVLTGADGVPHYAVLARPADA